MGVGALSEYGQRNAKRSENRIKALMSLIRHHSKKLRRRSISVTSRRNGAGAIDTAKSGDTNGGVATVGPV